MISLFFRKFLCPQNNISRGKDQKVQMGSISPCFPGKARKVSGTSVAEKIEELINISGCRKVEDTLDLVRCSQIMPLKKWPFLGDSPSWIILMVTNYEKYIENFLVLYTGWDKHKHVHVQQNVWTYKHITKAGLHRQLFNVLKHECPRGSNVVPLRSSFIT